MHRESEATMHATERLLRNGLSYRQAAANCQRHADRAYDETLAKGGDKQAAEQAAFDAFNREMSWYLS